MSDEPTYEPTYEVTNSMGPYGCVPAWVLRALLAFNAPAPYRCLAVYVTLNAIWANDGTCFPRRETIAVEVGCSVDSIDRAVKALVEIGALDVHERKDAAGDRTSNLYILHSIPWGGSRNSAATPHAGVSREKPSKMGGRNSAATGGRNSAALTRPSKKQNASRATSSRTHDVTGPAGHVGDTEHTWDGERFVAIRDGVVTPVPERTPQRDLVEALRAGCCWEKPTRPEHGRLGVVAKALREYGATAADVTHVCRRYRDEWPNMKITPEAVHKHWSAFATGPDAELLVRTDDALDYPQVAYEGHTWQDHYDLLIGNGYTPEKARIATDALDWTGR